MKAKLTLWMWALASACLLAPLPVATAEVVVYGKASSTGEFISVDMIADIASTRLLSFGLHLRYNPGAVAAAKAEKNELVWFFSDGITRYPYPDPDASIPGALLVIGGCLDGGAVLRGVAGDQVWLGRALFKRVSSLAPDFTLGIGHPAPFANFANLDGKALETVPGEVVFKGVNADPEDLDLDGLNDAWEKQYFGGVDQAYYSDDPDGDGSNNLEEQALGTNPTEPDASFRLSISKAPEGLWIEWPSAKSQVYTIECAKLLPVFSPLATDLPATPPTNKYLYPIGELRDALFFRVLSIKLNQ